MLDHCGWLLCRARLLYRPQKPQAGGSDAGVVAIVSVMGCNLWGGVSVVGVMGRNIWGAVAIVSVMGCNLWGVVTIVSVIRCTMQFCRRGGYSD